MEDLQTDTLRDNGKTPETLDFATNKESEDLCEESLLNGSDDIDDPLDLMTDPCDVSFGSNSDVWKGSDSEDENNQSKEQASSQEKNTSEDIGENNDESDKIDEEESDKTNENSLIESEEQEKFNEVNVNKPVEKEAATEVENEPHQEKESLVENNPVADKVSDDKGKDSGENDKDLVADKDAPDEKVPEEKDPLPVENHLADKDPVAKGDLLADKNSILEDLLAEKTSDEKDLVVEGDPLADKDVIAEEDPLAVISDETDPLASKDSGVNDPLVDKDPLALDETNRNPSVAARNEGVDDDCQMDYDAADDDDFDPSLLCPEVSMAIDDNPVVTNPTMQSDAGPDSPSLCDPLFSTFVDEVTGAEISFNLTPEELELRKRLYGPTNPVQYTRIHCTACNVHLGSALEGQNNRFVHPLLKVLICKDCYHFYTSGEFEKDEDGSELYCRWCGQGGQVLCCSKCEYVFCKRCIRTNFGRKKMFEIRDSDSWDCFRCNTSQIITQRIACYEFFEYVRREMSRAATLKDPGFWSQDYSRCCLPKKRPAENSEEKKNKKKKGTVDPDYNPLMDKPDIQVQPPSTSTNVQSFIKGIVLPKPIQLLPRFPMNKSKDNDIEFVRQIPAPHVTIGPRAAYRTILPNPMRPIMQPPALVRIGAPQQVPPLVHPSSRIFSTALQNRNNNANLMKHEWFEKTVRAAARVNSHLSYTLTQLNKAQSLAGSVEELAVVHNKLQEILSSSINSLIQIRKNLRTEFISGIKTVRLPSKKPEVQNNDDDVIFVSPPTMPTPSTSETVTAAQDPLKIVDKTYKPPIPAILQNSKSVQRGFLKVKSVKELQNVPPECITIPDDPIPPKVVEKKGKENLDIEIVRNGDLNADDSINKMAEKEKDKLEERRDSVKENGEPSGREKKKRSRTSSDSYNLKDIPSTEVKKMMSVKVRVVRDDLKELQRKLAKGS